VSRGLAIFDYDKTLVAGDSFRLFAARAAADRADRVRFLAHAVLAKLRLISNGRYKELVLDRTWRRLDPGARAALVSGFVDELRGMLVDPVVERLHAHLGAGDAVAVLSASPAFYLEAAVRSIAADVAARGSTVHEEGGRIHVDNLYGERKADAARELIAGADGATVHVYTDNRSDLPLMALADRLTLVRPSSSTVAAAERAGLDFEVLVP
jgi:phosphoserine phosphatase